jgi:hypothetical protein
MLHHSEIRQRDNDGMFEVVSGDTAAGPFPTITFAMQVAGGHPPATAPIAKFRRIKISEVRRDASA